MRTVEGGQIELVPAHLPGKVAMIAGVGQEGAADHVVRLCEFSDGNFRLAAVVGKTNRPAARYIGASGRNALEEAEFSASLRMQRDVLLLAGQLDQDDLAPQLIPFSIGNEPVLVARHANFQVC